MLIRFKCAYECYAKGETAKFEKEISQRLIDKGYASEVKAKSNTEGS